MSQSTLHCGDCLREMQRMPNDYVDLVITSPPYEDLRTYGTDFSLQGQAWVDWTVERFMEAIRVCTGLVAFVVEGKTRNYQWSATPALLMADLHRKGVRLRKPPIFHRIGVPGSGGKAADHAAAGGSADWLRNDYEFIVCGTKRGKLPWADTLAMGHPPKWNPGGRMSNRKKDGSRVNEDKPDAEHYTVPKLSNPGNTIQQKYTADEVASMLDQASNVNHYLVGGGLMGSRLCHENEAPFPEGLAEFFIRSFCPPGGLVLDPFCGSGTTCSVAQKFGRNYYGIDNRQGQIDLTNRRLKESA